MLHALGIETSPLAGFSPSPKADIVVDCTGAASGLATALASLVRRKLAMKSNDHIVITDAGRAAIGADEAAPEQADSATDIKDRNAEPLSGSAAPSARAGTKAALLMDLLSREGGATLDDLTRATGWLPHTVRAALSGLRKKGHAIASEKVDGVRAWRIIG